MDKTDFEEQLRDARREVERERELLMRESGGSGELPEITGNVC